MPSASPHELLKQQDDCVSPESLLPPNGSCPLLQKLPIELRLAIWETVLGTIIFAYGGGLADEKRPAPTTSLAFLRTCRQIYEEAGTSWIGRVLFYFTSPYAILDTLSPLPRTIVSQIRRVRVKGYKFGLQWRDAQQEDLERHKLSDVFKLLPYLQLDTLLVAGGPYAVYNYSDIWNAVNFGNGWRELQFFFPNSVGRGMVPFPRAPRRGPGIEMPSGIKWKLDLALRDGQRSGSSVNVYRSQRLKVAPSAPFDCDWLQDDYELFDERLRITEGGGRVKSATEDVSPGEGTPEPWKRAFLVAIKRGPGVNIAERDSPPFEPHDIRSRGHGTTWAEIKDCLYHD